MKQLMDVKTVAEALGVSPQCVYSLVAQGLLPAVRIGIGRGVIRFEEEAIERFIANCRFPKRRGPASQPA